MKKSKLLIPLFTLTGTAAIVAPVMTMTSCSQGEKEEVHFNLTTGSKTTLVSSPNFAGQMTYVFTCKDAALTEDDVKLIEPLAVISKSNSYITLNRCCITDHSTAAKTITVVVSYTISPSAFEYKEDEKTKKVLDPEKLEFKMTIHNGSWTQTIDGFSLTAKRNPKA